jgi:hypothetical protein
MDGTPVTFPLRKGSKSQIVVELSEPGKLLTHHWFGSTLVYNGRKRKKSPELGIKIHP